MLFSGASLLAQFKKVFGQVQPDCVFELISANHKPEERLQSSEICTNVDREIDLAASSIHGAKCYRPRIERMLAANRFKGKAVWRNRVDPYLARHCCGEARNGRQVGGTIDIYGFT